MFASVVQIDIATVDSQVIPWYLRSMTWQEGAPPSPQFAGGRLPKGVHCCPAGEEAGEKLV